MKSDCARPPLGTLLEQLEMRCCVKKIRRIRAPNDPAWTETAYSPDPYKDHTSGRQASTLGAFSERLSRLGLRHR